MIFFSKSILQGREVVDNSVFFRDISHSWHPCLYGELCSPKSLLPPDSVSKTIPSVARANFGRKCLRQMVSLRLIVLASQEEIVQLIQNDQRKIFAPMVRRPRRNVFLISTKLSDDLRRDRILESSSSSLMKMGQLIRVSFP